MNDDRPAWQRHGNCVGLDPALFFPERGELVIQAKAVCADCEVRVECLHWAIDNGEKWGVWGGTSERQRRAMRATRRGTPWAPRPAMILVANPDIPCSWPGCDILLTKMGVGPHMGAHRRRAQFAAQGGGAA